MSALVIAASSTVVIALSMGIIDDCFEWKKEINFKAIVLKQLVTMTFFLLIAYPFTLSYLRDGYSGKEVFVGSVFLFGYMNPILSKVISLGIERLKKNKAEE